MKSRPTVGELKKLLASLPDDTILLRPHSDHSYDPVRPEVVEVGRCKAPRASGGFLYYEWFGDPKHYDAPVEVVKAVVIS